MNETANSIDPILSESDRKPPIRSGTIIVAYDGSTANILENKKKITFALPDPDPDNSNHSEPAQPSSSSPFAEKLSFFGKKAARVGTHAAKVGGSQLATALKNSSLANRIFKNETRYFLVDISKKDAEFTIEADSANPAIPFKITISFNVQVKNPVVVVEKGVRDIANYHSAAIRRVIRDLSAGFSTTQMDEARKALQKGLSRGLSDSAVALSNISLRVVPDEKAADLLRQSSEKEIKIEAIKAKGEIEKEKTNIVSGHFQSPKDILAAWIATKDSKYHEIFIEMINEKRESQKEQIRLLDLGLEKGIIEEQDIHKHYPHFAKDLLKGLFTSPSLEEITSEKKD